MIKLVVLWSMPVNVAGFDADYVERHLPLTVPLPGLLATTVSTVGGSTFHRAAELHFADRAAMKAAMASPAGVALAADSERLQAEWDVQAQNLLFTVEQDDVR